MPTTTLWIDIGAYGLTTIAAVSLMMVVLGMGIRRVVNLSFALVMGSVVLWAGSSVILRIALWLNTGTQQFWMELSTMGFMLLAPLLLLFTGVYLRPERDWPYWVSVTSLILVLAFGVPLFQGQVLFNVRIGPGGTVIWDRTRFGWLTSVPLFVSAALVLLLLWTERRKVERFYLPLAFTLLVASSVVFSFVQLPFPTLSLAITLVIGLLGYDVVNRQLFNPLRELTEQLEEQVAERTRELEEAAGRLQRHVTYLQTAAEVARSVSAIRDVAQLLQDTVHLVSERFGFYHVGIFLLDEAREYAVLRAASSEGGQRLLARGHRLRVGEEGIVGRVARTGEPRVALDVGEDAVHFANPDLPDTRSEMALPLKVRGEVIGVLDVQSQEPEAFSEEDVAVLQTLADQLAVGLENARLFIQVQSSLDEVSRVYQVMAEKTWRELVEARPELQRYQAGPVAAPDGAWEALFAEARSRGGAATALWGEGGEARYALAVPVRLRGVAIGMLGFHRPAEAGEWRPEEVEMALGVAERMALALENIRLREEAQRRAAREQAVGEIASRVRASLDPDTVLRTTVRELGRALGARWAAVEVTGPEGGDGASGREEE